MRSNKVILTSVLAVGLVIGHLSAHWIDWRAVGSELTEGGGGKNGPKPATEATKKANAAFAKNLPFADKQAFADAQKGFIAPLPDKGVIKNKAGMLVWDLAPFSFIKLDTD